MKDSPLEFLLDAQKQWAFALNQEYQAIIDYNIALATFEFAKGTIMQSCKIRIAEGPLPDLVTMRAVEHEQATTHRRLAAERQRSYLHPFPGTSQALARGPSIQPLRS